MNSQKKKARIFINEVKERHTTHWDIDLLPREAVEAAYNRGSRRRLQSRRISLMVAALVVTAITTLLWSVTS